MRLLLDENLSPKLVAAISHAFPDSHHVEQLGLRGATDQEVWEAARSGGFVLVSKDNDFRQFSFLYGPPPKVVWLAVGNAGTDSIRDLLLSSPAILTRFVETPEDAFLILPLQAH